MRPDSDASLSDGWREMAAQVASADDLYTFAQLANLVKGNEEEAALVKCKKFMIMGAPCARARALD